MKTLAFIPRISYFTIILLLLNTVLKTELKSISNKSDINSIIASIKQTSADLTQLTTITTTSPVTFTISPKLRAKIIPTLTPPQNDELLQKLQALSTQVEQLTQQVNFRIDSGDLENAGVGVAKELKEAISQLSKNWEVAINTKDLRGVGGEAAKSLSEALQNINAKLEVYISIDDNTLSAVGYVSAAIGVAFSVLLVAILVSIKQFRSCTVALFAHKKRGQEVREEVELEQDNRLDKTLNTVTQNDTKDCQPFLTTSFTIELKEFGNDSKPKVKERISSVSLARYDNFDKVRNYWEKKTSDNGADEAVKLNVKGTF